MEHNYIDVRMKVQKRRSIIKNNEKENVNDKNKYIFVIDILFYIIFRY